jgi:hypothetical protein
MKISGMAKVFGFTALLAAQAQEPARTTVGKPVVPVYVNNSQMIPGGHLGQAQAMVNRIFAPANVRFSWKLDSPGRVGRAEVSDCLPRLEIRIDFVTAKDGVNPEALAQAFPYASDGIRIAILVDRLEPFFRARPRLATAHLAHVLAHEIAHILQKISRHSETGLMKARWSEDDYKQMLKGMHLEAVDVNLIRLGMAARLARPCSAQVAGLR